MNELKRINICKRIEYINDLNFLGFIDKVKEYIILLIDLEKIDHKEQIKEFHKNKKKIINIIKNKINFHRKGNTKESDNQFKEIIFIWRGIFLSNILCFKLKYKRRNLLWLKKYLDF